MTISDFEGHPTRHAILQSACNELDAFGPVGFKISRVLESVNASYSSLYHHFDDREGLLRAANAQMFRVSNRYDLAAIAGAAIGATTTAEFFNVCARQFFAIANNPELMEARQQRISALAFGLTDPDLLEIIIEVQKQEIAVLASIFDLAKDRGLIRQNLNTESYVAWILGMLLGHILLEIDPELGPRSITWDRCTILAALQPLTPNHEPLVWSSDWEFEMPREWERASKLIWGEAVIKPKHPTAKLLIKNTIHILENQGEKAVRIPLVLADSGTSVTSIYHFFGDRAGLLAAAQAERFMQLSPIAVVDYRATTALARSADDFFAFLRFNLIAHATEEAVVRWRWGRIEILGSALRNASLLASVSQSQRGIIDQIAAISSDGQSRGFISSEIMPHEAAIWFQGMQMGRVLTEIQPELNTNEEWIDYAIEGIDAAFRCR